MRAGGVPNRTVEDASLGHFRTRRKAPLRPRRQGGGHEPAIRRVPGPRAGQLLRGSPDTPNERVERRARAVLSGALSPARVHNPRSSTKPAPAVSTPMRSPSWVVGRLRPGRWYGPQAVPARLLTTASLTHAHAETGTARGRMFSGVLTVRCSADLPRRLKSTAELPLALMTRGPTPIKEIAVGSDVDRHSG